MLYTNATGTDKGKLLILGKTQNPRCFKRFNANLYCDYHSNTKAWMVTYILHDYLKSLNSRMRREKHNILL